MRQYRKLLLEKCLYALRDAHSTSVHSEGMEALAKILAELREGDIGSFFNAISEQCRSFFDNVSPDKSLAGPRPWVGAAQVLNQVSRKDSRSHLVLMNQLAEHGSCKK